MKSDKKIIIEVSVTFTHRDPLEINDEDQTETQRTFTDSVTIEAIEVTLYGKKLIHNLISDLTLKIADTALRQTWRPYVTSWHTDVKVVRERS